MKSFTFLTLICTALIFLSCGEDPVVGCMDPTATNYDPLADEDSGACTYRTGCMDPDAANYDSEAIVDSGDCKYPGCTDEDGDNYDAMFNEDDGSCTYFDRFLGSYDGVFTCAGAFAGVLDEASSEITKRPGANNLDSITVVVSNPATNITLLLTGTITKDVATIDTYIQNFDYTLDTGTGLIIEGPFEVFVTGTLTRIDETTLSGPISIRIDKAELGLSIPDTCDYVATKS